MSGFTIHTIFGKLSPIFRRKRMALFFATFKPTDRTRVVDLGGLPGTWTCQPGRFPVVLVNLDPHVATDTTRFRTIQGDATQLDFPDDSFDVLFSNSVIEHVGTWEKQQVFAQTARRLAPRLWVQTPARCFPIEPHLIAPFVHYLPAKMQRHLLRWCTIWGWLNKPSRQEVDDFLKEVRLLTYREMKELFPDCEILRERTLGLTKSYIAVRR